MMIRIVDRYLLTQIAGGVLLTMLVLVGIDAFISFINELDEVGRGDYGFSQAASYILFTLPRRIYDYAPTAVLIGGLLSLGGMAAQNEVTALRAAGLSVWGFVGSILKIGVLFVLIIFLVGELAAPAGSRHGQQLKSKMLSGKAAVSRQGGVWIRHKDLFVRSRVILDGQSILDLDIFRFDGLRLVEAVHAGSAERMDNGWLLKNLARAKIGENGIVKSHSDSEVWPELVARNLFEVLSVNPSEMGMTDLYAYTRYLEDNALDSGAYKLAFWNRFVVPLSSIVMLLLALPFVFSSQRSGGAGQRLFIGVLLGIGYFLSSRLLNQLGLVYGLPPFLAAILPPTLFLLLAWFLLRRVA
ncbi:MAG TPA: LPS export ABC transporter permease LptG [Gammaproteobacteria bacterium]|nr:LPS export ABC transporter permease LptG [Gammaproteobacteria bacterium]